MSNAIEIIKSNITSRALVLFSLLVFVGIFGLFSYQNDPSRSTKKLQKLISDHPEIVKNALQKADYNPQNDLTLPDYISLEWYKNDSLAYWQNVVSHSQESLLTMQDSLDKNYWKSKIELDKNEDNLIDYSLLSEIDIHHVVHLNNRKTPDNFFLSPKTYAKIDQFTPNKLLQITGVIALVLFFISMISILFQKYQNQPSLGIFLTITLGVVIYTLDLPGLLYLQKSASDSYTSLSGDVVYCLLFSIAFFSIVNLIIKTHKSNNNNISSPLTNSIWIWSLVYFVITTSIIGFIFLVQFITEYFDPFLNLSRIFDLSTKGLLVISSILIIVLGLFLAHYYLYQILYRYGAKGVVRLSGIVLSIYFSCIILYSCLDHFYIPYLAISLLIYFIMLDLFVELRSKSVTWLIWWMIVLNTFITILLFHHISIQDEKRIVTGLDMLSAPMSDTHKKEIVAIKTDLLETNLDLLGSIPYPQQFNPEDLNSFLNENLKSISSLNPDVGVKAFVLDNENNSLVDEDIWNYTQLMRSLSSSTRLEENVSYDFIKKAFILQKQLKASEHPGSPLKLLLRIKTNKEFTPKFDYGLYKNKQLTRANNSTFPYQLSDQEINSTDFIGRQIDREFFLLAKKESFELIKPISLFSLLFTLFGILIFSLTLSSRYLQFLPDAFHFSFTSSSLRNRIQVAVVMLIVISFVIIGFVTVMYFQNLAREFDRKNLYEKIQTVQQTSFDQLRISNSTRALQKIGRDHQLKLELYDKNGRWVSSSNPNLNFVHKTYLDHATYTDMQSNGGKTILQYTKDSGLQGIARADISSQTSYIEAQLLENRESSYNKSDFIGTLLNVYVFLFLIAGAIAIAVANSITYPIAVLGEKLRKVKLGKSNEPLQWESNDELGVLIKEYNAMIDKLEKSAEMLARTERDSAWRGMAKQVAHEIKNPLTPMKLSIQYLEKATQSNPEQAQQMIKRVAQTLIEQIDNLSQIATAFSNFGTLPKTENTKIILNEIVEKIHDLFRKRDDMDIQLTIPIDDIIVFADKNHLVRILNNLVKNAIQSIPNDRRGIIKLDLYKEKGNAIIKVSDNGIGITDDKIDKVFTPNFTTKSSGTGLGLAISANMIETFNGRIYFETEVDEGSDFFMEIPLMRKEDNLTDEKRVSLE